MNQTLHVIEEDLDALDAILADLGGDVSEEEAEAAVNAWFAELGDARDAKLNGYARRIQALESHAEAKKAEIARLAAQRKQDESAADWMKRRLLSFVRERGTPIKGKPTRMVETSLFKFTETMNGGKEKLTYLTDPLELPAELRQDVITIVVSAEHEKVWMAVFQLLHAIDGADFTAVRTALPVEPEVREALERGDEARAARAKVEADTGVPLTPYFDERIFRYARLEPRGVRLAIR